MKKITAGSILWKLAALFICMFFGIIIYLLSVGDHFSYYYRTAGVAPESSDTCSVQVEFDENGIIHYDGFEISKSSHLKLNFSSAAKGSTSASIHIMTDDFSTDIKADFLVGSFHQIIAEFSDSEFITFQGWPVVICGITVYSVAACVILFLSLRRRYRVSADIFSYATILTCAAFLYFLAISILLIIWLVRLAVNPEGNTFASSVNMLMQITSLAVMLTIPLDAVFSIVIAISNFSLIRHEGMRPANLLGIGIGVFLLFLIAAFYGLFKIGYSVRYLLSIYAGVILLFESLFAAAVICAVTADKHKPAFDKDYIIILGCGIKKDGTLMPLLKGRVDRALRFYREQLAATGKKACFVPSGGQGPDEIISESEAMKRYLLSEGIGEEMILKEDRSTNTLENMLFSRKLITERNPHAKVVFSTTNYHVFRSGMFAMQAELDADGIGSKTKWYFWPNAFVREFIGVLVHYWRYELTALFLVIFLTLLNLLLYHQIFRILLTM